MKKSVLKNYAHLLAVKGINVQAGQEVIIDAQIDMPDFVAVLVEECYKAGAGKVTVNFSYQPLEALHVKYQSEKTLGIFENWEKARQKHYLDSLPARIYLLSEDPDGLNGIDQEKYSNALGKRRKAIKPFRDAMDNKYQWCIAAVPGKAWAKKMFPGLSEKKAIEKLWEAILSSSRALENPLDAWNNHNENLSKRCEYLNSLGIERLHYSASNGTDFTVGLIREGQFLGGAEKTLSGVVYNPNIPSEEVFTTPDKSTANGVVYSTKPLSYNGQIIDNFSIRFENGVVVEVSAEKNEELLKKMIKTDDGAAMLGECALIPCNSPINNSGLVFFNTLFDENASCHLALGRGFTECIKNYDKYTLEECQKMGVNDSVIHEDFMIGTPDLSIVAFTFDGREVEIFKDGNWAF